MQAAIQHLVEHFSPENIRIRSMHYNPLGDLISPSDWRNPRVVDGYNVILKRVSRKLGVRFLDSQFIIGPMWDTARDWCHYDKEAGMKDAL